MLERERCGIVQCGRAISQEEIAQIRETVGTFGRLSRWELAETVCEHLQWRTASGSNKVDACLKLLDKLASQGFFRLPEKRGSSRKVLRKPGITERTGPGSAIIGSVSDIGLVRLSVVGDREGRGLWNEYVSRYHYLDYKQPFGCRQRYFIESERGKLGCLMFSGAAKSIGIRDRWIGWSEADRLRNLGWIVNNTRFLIFPWVRLKYLASHILGQAARRIREDWQERWGYRPVLLETFVDPRYFEGICYLAANWLDLGMTTGEGLVREGKSYTTSPKKLLVLPLVENFREVLCSSAHEVRP
jgi:hypothetical protein